MSGIGTRLPNGDTMMRVSVSGDDFVRVASPIIDCANAMLDRGEDIDLVLAGMLYATGCSLARRGVRLDTTPFRQTLAPLVAGYENARAEMGRKP